MENLNFKLARLAAGFKQRDLARLAGVPEWRICQWETGRGSPDKETQRLVASLLGVKTFEIFNR